MACRVSSLLWVSTMLLTVQTSLTTEVKDEFTGKLIRDAHNHCYNIIRRLFILRIREPEHPLQRRLWPPKLKKNSIVNLSLAF